MTHSHFVELDNIKLDNILQPIFEKGFEGMSEVMAEILNIAMNIERQEYLKADAYERSADRIGYANGYKPRSIKTRVGKVEVQVPQVRGTEPYKPSMLEVGQRQEKALAVAVAEMYVQGVSTRKVKKVMQELCGFDVSSAQVSQAAKELDEVLEKWRQRPLGEITALILDARYEKVRMDGCVVSCALLTACGIDSKGYRQVLGTSVSLSEAEVHWRNFLESLLKRGMHGVKYIVSDSHTGLTGALRSVLPGVLWQRCQFHLQQNAQPYITKKSLKSNVANDIRTVFNAPDEKEASRLLKLYIEKYSKTQKELAVWMEDNIPDGFAVFQLPNHMRQKLRTSNMMENLNRQIKRRTGRVGAFTNEESLLRLASAILSEISDDWESNKRYLDMNGLSI
jgi:putative transposase